MECVCFGLSAITAAYFRYFMLSWLTWYWGLYIWSFIGFSRTNCFISDIHKRQTKTNPRLKIMISMVKSLNYWERWYTSSAKVLKSILSLSPRMTCITAISEDDDDVNNFFSSSQKPFWLFQAFSFCKTQFLVIPFYVL